MTPSMPRPITTSATITSMSVKPRAIRAIRLLPRIGNTLLALVLVRRRLGLRDERPVALVFALLDPQIAVGERGHAPQGRRAIAFELQLERHYIAARQHGQL